MKSLLFLVFFVFFSGQALALKFASGIYTGTGADNETVDISSTTSPSVSDFQPNVVFAKCSISTPSQITWRTSAMPANQSFALFSTVGAVTDRIKAFNAFGFTVGTNSAVNGSGLTCWYTALAIDATDNLSVGSYTGDGSNDRNLTISPAFLPELVMIQGGLNRAEFRVPAIVGDLSCPIENVTCGPNTIQALQASGFQLGTASQVNAAATVYYYMGIKAISGSTVSGSYLGNAIAGPVTTGFQPEFVFIKANNAFSPHAKFKAQTTDLSCTFANGTCNSDRIKAFLSNGFEVGTQSEVNPGGGTVTVYWYAMKSPAAAAVAGAAKGSVVLLD
jgi:hypothetical protein